MKNVIQILLLLVLPFIWTACQEKEDDFTPDDAGLGYYPLTIGKYIDYQVDSIIYDFDGAAISKDTVRVYIRHEVVDTFSAPDGQISYRIERFQKDSLSGDWGILDVWTATNDGDKIILNAQNFTIIPFVFPVRERKKWDVAALIGDEATIEIAGETIAFYKNWSTRYSAVGTSYTFAGETLEECVEVEWADDENIIEKRVGDAIFAKGIGMVYNRLEILDSQSIDDDRPFNERADKGLILRMEMIGHN